MANNYYDGFEHNYFTTSDGVKLHYVVKGEGEPFIFIHGLNASYASYCKLAPALSSRYRVYVVDLRGHGMSDKPAYGARISRLSADMYEFQQSLGYEKKIFAGASMGCAVIWSMASLFGQDYMDKLIFLDQAPFLLGNPMETDAQIRQYGARRFDLWQLHNAFNVSMNDGVDSLLNYFNADLYPDEPELWAILGSFEGVDAEPKFIAKLVMDHMINDWRDTLPRIAVPCLLLAGDRSYASTQESNQWMADNMPDCKYVQIPGATHMFTIPFAEEILKAMDEFL